METAINFLDKFSLKWEKPKGLLTAIIILFTLYFTLIVDRLKELIGDNSELFVLYILIPIVLIFLIYVIWLISTNRVNWIKNNKITVGIILTIDDESSEEKIKHLVNETLNEINLNFKDIKLRLYPINHLNQTLNLEKYYIKKRHVLDAIVFAKVETGKKKNSKDNTTEDVLVINEITFQGNFDVNYNLTVFETTVNLANEIRLRGINKNWAYVESNSYEDKIKLKSNLKDTILYYCGIYLIYQNNYESSLLILKSLYNKSDSQVKISPKEKKIYYKSKKFFGAARLNDILLNLYTLNAIREYTNKNNSVKAYNALKECESSFGRHPQTYGHSILLARFSYENNNELSEAKKYTEIAKKIKPNSTEVFLNQGFFGLVENNVDQVFKNYKELAHTYRHEKYIHYIDIVHFLTREKEKYDNKTLFEFAIGTINFLYGDKKLGNKTLLKIKNSSVFNTTEYTNILNLVVKILKNGPIKSVYNKKNKNSPKKKKRKRKRKNRNK